MIRILAGLAAMIAGAALAHAQQGVDPALGQALAAPSDGAAYYARREEARRLVLVANDYAAAEPLLETLTRDYPQEGHNWLLLGRTKLRLGKASEAIPAYARAERMLGSGAPYQAGYWLAASQAAAGQEEAALATLERLVFHEHYLSRSELMEDDAFVRLRANPRFRAIAGAPDISGWSRNAGWQHDVDALRDEVARNVVLESGRSLPPAFAREHARLRAAVPRLTNNQIVVGLSRMLATLGRGHTALWPVVPSRIVTFTQLPAQLYAFPEGVFIVRSPQHPELAGAEVLKIGDVTAMEALSRIGALQSRATPMETLWLGPVLLSVTQYLEGAGIIRSAARVPLTLRLRNGQTIERTVAAVPIDLGTRLTPPPGVPAPRFLSHMNEAHWTEPLPGSRTLYVQVNQIASDDDESLPAFGRRVRTMLEGDSIRSVILDLRHNNGGDTFTYAEFLRTMIAFSARPDRHLYVLIGRNVYSAASNLTTDLERLASPVFIGEPTSMTGNSDGDEFVVRLPYSGLVLGITGAHWQLSTPWDRRTSLVPDIPISFTARAYFAGQDPVLDAALARIRENPGTTH